jgi:calcium/proton exchanger cax
LLRVVKLTLLGSIISNLLLVMGSAFVAGGIVHPTQRFNQQGVAVNCGLLILAGKHNVPRASESKGISMSWLLLTS